jgi:hypothetical protein
MCAAVAVRVRARYLDYKSPPRNRNPRTPNNKPLPSALTITATGFMLAAQIGSYGSTVVSKL